MNQNTRRDPRAKVLSMTVRYRSATLGEFIEHHSYDVSRGGMFIKTPSPFPPGTLLKFEVKIAGEQRVMQGVGRVVWKRDKPSEETGEPAGMGIKFIKIDDSSKSVIEKLIEARGPETEGAFEHSPEGSAPPKMFPVVASSSEPPPEDRTVMKPASDLLNEALVKTGQTKLSEAVPNADAIPIKTSEPVDSEPPAPVSKVEKIEKKEASEALESARKPAASEISRASEAERQKRASAAGAESARKSTSREDEEQSGGRAFVLLLVAALVMGGIFVLMRRASQSEEPEQSTQATTPAPSATPIPAPEPVTTTPLVEKVLVEELPPEQPSATASSEKAEAPAASASASVAPAASIVPPAPPKPKVVKKPKPIASAEASSPAGESTPAPTPAPEPTPAPATPAPASP